MSDRLTIDAHQHFWDPDAADYPWMTETLDPIRRIFVPDDLRPEIANAGISKTILVQTRASEDETRQFLRFADTTDFIAGVVGWVDLTSPDVGDALDRLLAAPQGKWLVGIRHQVHDEPDADWLLRADVGRGLGEIQKRDLTYDLLLRPREIPAALKTVEAHPGLRFVVDHAAKPDIAAGGFAPWAELMKGFAAHRGHVWCKLSGLVTEADWARWTPEQIRPYIDEVLEIFGPSRCIFGSDWPVCLLAATYSEVTGLARNALANLTEQEQADIFGNCAVEAYKLQAGRL